MSRINSSLSKFIVPITLVKEDSDNARKHSDRNISAIMASLHEFGQQKPIVAKKDGTIIAGNGTHRAAVQLGWTEIAAVFFDSEDGIAATGFAIADNRTAELAEWDVNTLKQNLEEISKYDIKEFGWSEEEMANLFSAIGWNPPAAEEFSPTLSSQAPDMKSIIVSVEERAMIERGIEKVRENAGDFDMSEGRAIELFCAEYLGGP